MDLNSMAQMCKWTLISDLQAESVKLNCIQSVFQTDLEQGLKDQL